MFLYAFTHLFNLWIAMTIILELGTSYSILNNNVKKITIYKIPTSL